MQTAGAERKKLVLINGLPGTGKTTLKKRLSIDLDLPAIGKDDLKEFLFDVMGVHGADAQWLATLGVASSQALDCTIESLLTRDYDLIAESAFIYEFEHARLTAIINRTGVSALELYCQTSDEIRRKRFGDRGLSGQRHQIHTDSISSLSYDELAVRYAPLTVGKLLVVDTTQFGDAEYSKLLEEVREFLADE